MAEGLARVGIHGAYEGALQHVGNPELISRTHFARFLVDSGVCRDTHEVFRRFLTEGKPGFVPHRWASLGDAVAWITRAGGTTPFAAIIAVVATIFAIYTLLLGPQLARQDLRSDLPNADILKTYPLTGWQILLGQLLTPIAILTGLLWLSLLAVMLALAPRAETLSWLTPGFRLTAGLCAAAVIPALCTLQLLIPNAAALLFPAWFQSTRTRGGGIELMGQRLIFVIGQLFVILISLLPVVLSCALVIFASQWLVGPTAAVVLATLLALAILAAEIAGGLWWLGERFEKLDLATELRP
jgi:hypothetical protein